MTNYNERLDEILDNVLIGMYCTNPDGDFVPLDDSKNVLRAEAKQAITSLIKELVAEAKPKTMPSNLSPEDYEKCERVVNQYHQNLLKALEEVI